MGQDITATQFTPEDRQRYREKLKRCLDTLRILLEEEDRFEVGRSRIGLELEIYLVDRSGTPMMVNDEVLARIEAGDFQTELGQFNIEFNLSPHKIVGTVFRELEDELRASLNHALRRAEELDARMLIVGILPTLKDLHVTRENLSNNPRYHALNDQILAARGEAFRIEIEGRERLMTMANSIMMEAASTSCQLHLQVDPDDFARYWNAAQALSAAQLAVGSNSPFFLGKELWRETRIALFEQSIDTRTAELAAQGVRPRVWFGERWIDHVLDLYEENVRYFPTLLPLVDDEDPFEVLDRGDVPHLRELALHNGTIYRWNRPVYTVARGRPHLRVENRVLPAGPSVADVIANAAFYYGATRALAEASQPVSQQMSFGVATDNFFAAARDGIDAQLYWPGLGTLSASELVGEHLLPLADEGLGRWNIDAQDRERFLGIIEQRCLTRQIGATWQVATVRHLTEHDGLDRDAALLEMTRCYIEHMHANEPVHTWPVPCHA
ncbi:MAG: glutamate--cysteine ligase [Actinobacteria bacterium]|nr:glutamate--cysteine ligase [Actinomycetota bacterium]